MRDKLLTGWNVSNRYYHERCFYVSGYCAARIATGDRYDHKFRALIHGIDGTHLKDVGYFNTFEEAREVLDSLLQKQGYFFADDERIALLL